jgi:hypothetical protein
MAYQPFQGGFMIWRASSSGDAGGTIYVFLNSGQWQVHYDPWVEGMPVDGGYSPPAGLFEPKRGFGMLWRNTLGGPSSALGWALSEEQGHDSGLAQELGNGGALLRFPGQAPVYAPWGRAWVR